MAGSYGHVTDGHGRFIGTRLLENDGDVYEAVEEMYGMIQWLAYRLAAHSPETLKQVVTQAEGQYKLGLELGGRVEPDE